MSIRIIKLLTFITLFLFLPFAMNNINARATDDEVLYNQMLDIANADDINTYSASDYLDEYGIVVGDTQTFQNISIETVFGAVKTIVLQQITMPLRLFASTIGAVLLMAAMQSVFQSGNICALECKSVGTLVCVIIISAPVSECLEGVCSSVVEGADFLSGLVPVFSSLTLFSGGSATSCAYSSAMLCYCGFASNLCSMVLLPMLSCTLALSVVDSISPVLKLGNLTNGIKKVTITALCFIMVIFTGVLSLQTSVAASSDNVALKAGKYVVSSTIPIVGGAVSEAFTSINAGIGVLRNAVGAFGVIALGFIILPMLAKVFLCNITLKSAEFVADMFGVDELARLISSFHNVLSTALAVLVSFFVMSFISSVIVMAALGG